MHIYCKTTNKIGFNVTNVIFGEISLNKGNKVVQKVSKGVQKSLDPL